MGRVPALGCEPTFISDLADAVIESLPYVGAMAVSNLEARQSLVPLGSIEELLAGCDSQRRELPPPVTVWEWGWTKSAETWNGRSAMLAVLVLLVLEIPRASASAVVFGMGLLSGRGNLGTGCNQAFAVTSESRASDRLYLKNYLKNRKSQEPSVLKLKEPALDEITHALVGRYNLNFTRQDISSLWFLCKQEASLLNITDQACALFTPSEMGVPSLEDVVQSMEQAIKAKEEEHAPGCYKKARLRFAHAETLLPFSCLIGLFLEESGTMEEKAIMIRELSYRSHKWRAKLRVIQKQPPRTTKLGTTTIQQFILTDSEGSRIQATCFDDDIPCLMAYSMYTRHYFSNGIIKYIDPRNRIIDNTIQLMLNSRISVEETESTEEANALETYFFIQLADASDYITTNIKFDIAAIATNVLPTRTITKRIDGQPAKVREIFLIDQSLERMQKIADINMASKEKEYYIHLAPTKNASSTWANNKWTV
ncbi:hypothetical protein TEA_005037 [Camellia sinensis var. sinensis]|uniref:Uncharacterized protein n=1 Tax=Camellia sinensis var. sinensis TaxID=542762 RepID=A0A4S4D8J6_CAMSN|nr:hypothetical protein TEA_005037 [Camellia sinensis var. sinensis]